MLATSKRSNAIPTSAVRQLAAYEQEATKKGVKVLHLNIGAPDLDVSSVFFQRICAIESHQLQYVPSAGVPELIQEVQTYYKNMGASFEKNEIYVTTGGSEALLYAFIALCEAGDRLLVPEPLYSNYISIAKVVEVEIDGIPTTIEEGFHLPSKEEIVRHIHPKTKAILLSNPANPTGVTYSVEEVKRIAEIAKEHHLWIIADEVYREYIYDGFATKSFSLLPEVAQQTVIIDSISKRFSACGARVGFLLTKNQELAAIFLKLCQSRLSGTTLEQIGAAALYREDMDFIRRSIPEFKERRDVMCDLLAKVPGVTLRKPEGAFYLMVGLPVEDSLDFSKWLLTEFAVDQTTVMLTPGAGFYTTPDKGKNEVRIAYVLNIESIKKAVAIIEAGLKAYNQR
ncbi:pyridoxal phosphate-dependent aminotransferase [Entomospira culicis]|uniref:Aminotransferase n=1 Tax=Entomospira culicis TaxID=2719989 RepID=A0A968GE96_9SPIO|nr:pyridoxal phosphate-dependent aminotransferase [Entomospira culicis]NIZ18766.1 pyridoxal phosphate-dependent aminotransferase [Entomospira culicis]NIZ68981.1 pyridoxal phosphate-dependent aminotransferase [Entomospira culicis]WDI37572.1 pyridoxal phosphate-dependent aminotransferase [Entomospira culicis]WDI39200.1 pyridoxal phosphate-dependent aminotransferase [Entomospira culicis]